MNLIYRVIIALPYYFKSAKCKNSRDSVRQDMINYLLFLRMSAFV